MSGTRLDVRTTKQTAENGETTRTAPHFSVTGFSLGSGEIISSFLEQRQVLGSWAENPWPSSSAGVLIRQFCESSLLGSVSVTTRWWLGVSRVSGRGGVRSTVEFGALASALARVITFRVSLGRIDISPVSPWILSHPPSPGGEEAGVGRSRGEGSPVWVRGRRGLPGRFPSGVIITSGWVSSLGVSGASRLLTYLQRKLWKIGSPDERSEYTRLSVSIYGHPPPTTKTLIGAKPRALAV